MSISLVLQETVTNLVETNGNPWIGRVEKRVGGNGEEVYVIRRGCLGDKE